MRWIWIDRFLEFESGRRARAVKNVSLAEEHLQEHFYSYPVMPNSLIVEGIAQTGGLLVGEHNHFRHPVVLAKLPKAVFHFAALPGDQLIYDATLEYIKEDGAMVTATSRVGDRVQAEMEVVFAHLLTNGHARTVFEPKNFVFTMKLLGVFDVGRSSNGQRVDEPPGLVQYRAEMERTGLDV